MDLQRFHFQIHLNTHLTTVNLDVIKVYLLCNGIMHYISLHDLLHCNSTQLYKVYNYANMSYVFIICVILNKPTTNKIPYK